VAATLELRGYSLPSRPRSAREAFHDPRVRKGFNRGPRGSRYDGRFYAVGAAVLVAAIAARIAGADGFEAYPTVELGIGAGTVALSVLVVLAGLAPWRRHA
jgi:hypothetical protein